ncbi:MAG TPA: hypothetical protein VGH13_16960, partial [Xanthobacteraceae bacterium]
MRKLSLLAAAILLSTAAGAPNIAKAIEGANPAPPAEPSAAQSGRQPGGAATSKKVKKPKPQKNGSAEDFLKNWHKAYALVYDKKDYDGGIAVL